MSAQKGFSSGRGTDERSYPPVSMTPEGVGGRGQEEDGVLQVDLRIQSQQILQKTAYTLRK